MQCEYCGSYIQIYPANGICPNCSATLPAPPVSAPQTVNVVIQQQPLRPQTVVLQPGINCCSRCRSTDLMAVRRGFRWGLALLGFFLLPPVGLLLGLVGKNRTICTCRACGHRWKS